MMSVCKLPTRAVYEFCPRCSIRVIRLLSRLFLEMRSESPDTRKMLPLKHQQRAFENIYLKAQEGMKLPVSSNTHHVATCFTT